MATYAPAQARILGDTSIRCYCLIPMTNKKIFILISHKQLISTKQAHNPATCHGVGAHPNFLVFLLSYPS